MRKLLLSWLLLIAAFMNAQVALGSGTSQGGAFPADVNYGYNYTQQIFTKSEINTSAAGNITGLTFYLPNNADISKSVDWVVYVGHTSKATFTTTADWVPVSALTQVFSGAITASGNQVTVNFTTPFAYNNTDNLLIAIDENTASFTAGSNRFYTYTGVAESSIYYRSDTTNPDPASPPTGIRSSLKSVTSLLGLTPLAAPGCPVVTVPAANAANTSVFPTITWGVVNNASSYRISVGTSPGASDVLNMQDAGIATSYTFANALNFNTQYYYTVYAVNAAGTSTACSERSFTTAATPACPSVSAPSAAQTGVPLRTAFAWSAVSGAAGYRINLGTSPGATDILNNFDVGNSTAYTLTAAQQLNPTTKYYYTIIAYSGSVTSAGCTERNFITTVAAPANDDCAGAVTLPVNSDLSCAATAAGNTQGATQSLAAAPCSGGPDDDVWFKFTAASSSHVIRLSNVVSTGSTTGITDMYFQVLSGTCGNQTSLLCSDDDLNLVSGLTPGQTYYIRVYTYSSVATANASFTICVGTPPAPPANDNCSDAVNVTVNPDMNCGTVVSGTTAGATSSGVALGTCTGVADDDVWYTFTATAANHTLKLNNIVSVGTASSTSLYAQVFSGACGTLTSVRCITSNTNFSLLSGLTPGQTYYVRVYNSNTNSGGTFYSNSFDLCIGTLPAVPSNDDCAGAVNLTVNPGPTCSSPVAGSTLSATGSGLAVTPCTGTADDDVWYTFTAAGTAHNILLSDIASTGSNTSASLYIQVFSGACGALTSVKCGTTANTALTGLTPGQVYYVRVYNSNANTATAIYSNSFSICIATPPPPPANDDCLNAVALTVSNLNAFAALVNGTTVSATQSTATAPACNTAGINDDVWYYFTATSASHLVHVLYSDNATTTQIYSGACGSLVSVGCFDGAYGNSNVLLQNLNVGQTYYVRVFSSSSVATTASNFQIAVTTPSVNNDTCATATALACNGSAQGSNALATDDVLPASTCGSAGSIAISKGVWFTVTASENGPITVDACGTQYDSYLRVYSGSCSALTCVSNVSGVGYSDSACANIYDSPKVTFTGVAGTTYYVLLTGYTAARIGNYNISVTQGCTSLATAEVNGKKESLKAYPNPFSDILNISDIAHVKSISVVDVAGRTVKSFDKAAASLDLKDLNSGLYLVILNMEDGSRQTIKAIKK